MSSFFNTAGFLVKAQHTGSILNILDALISEEGCGCMLMEELPSRGVCGDSNPRRKGAYIAFYILCRIDPHILEPCHFPQARD